MRVQLVMAAAIVSLVMEMEKRNTFPEHAVYVAATVIVCSVPAQEKKNVSFAQFIKESALPVMVMENVIDAAVTVPIVVCVMDPVIEIVPIALTENAVYATVSRFVRPAAVPEKSAMNAMMANVLPAVLSPDNRQVRKKTQPEITILSLRSSRIRIATPVTAAGSVRTAVAMICAKTVIVS